MKVGILSVSDKRPSVHEELSPYILACEGRIKAALEAKLGSAVEVVTGSAVVNKPSVARKVGREFAAQSVDCIIANIAIFSFPSLTLSALGQCSVPCLAWTIENPGLPGLVGLMANTGFLHQTDVACERVWGSEQDPAVIEKVLCFVRAAHAAHALKGQVFGNIGGRSIGMGTGAHNPIAWQRIFGIDTDHTDQLEIVRRAALVDESSVEKGFAWVEKHMGEIRYDGDKLTKESLAGQIRYYLALREIVEENEYDFIGVKCHYELSAYYSTPCLAISMLNDPYDFNGKKAPLCCSCEADADGALSMHILRLLTSQPSFLVDMRYYNQKENLFTLCNCGSVATWFAGGSEDPAENLRQVKLSPIIPKYKGTGCHTTFIAAPGEMTFARLSWQNDHYKMVVFCGESVSVPEEKLKETTPQWPHVFIRPYCNAEKLLAHYESNHLHGVYGDHVKALEQFCKIEGLEFAYID